MVAIALALLAAASWGFSAVLVRMALRDVSTSLGTLISLAAGLVFTGVLVLIFQVDDLLAVTLPAILIFAVIGILNFPMGRFFNYMAMGRIGVSRSTPILASAPVFAVVIAIAFTGERLDLATLVGAVFIFIGLLVTLTDPSRA
ncbi:MAG: EamA family transporter [Chloroflexi bacterium]|nr:EamA family transporter [Chloroflexota bacterium]MQC17392.1 hypothetical protein [Chloroflexota bacterium]